MNTNSSTKGKREIERLSFEAAKGGVISRASFRTHRGGQGGGPIADYDEDKPAVHSDMESAVSHLKKHLGKCFGEDSTADGSPDRETKADKE